MRYRVKKDFVLNGTLLAWGDSLFLQQTQHKEQWEVYSLFSRQLVGIITTEMVEEHLDEYENPPQEKRRDRPKGKSLRDISLALLMFILPLRGITQINVANIKWTAPIQWYTNVVQTGNDIYELHVGALMDTNYFLYPVNDRKKCEFCPTITLEASSQWELLEAPSLYSYGAKLPVDRCGSLPNPYCPVERYTGSVLYIFVCKVLKEHKPPMVKGFIEYYLTNKDSTGSLQIYRFARPFYK